MEDEAKKSQEEVQGQGKMIAPWPKQSVHSVTHQFDMQEGDEVQITIKRGKQ
jgi:hypothetical protein